jgi:Protein of unknown function (DUF1279)
MVRHGIIGRSSSSVHSHRYCTLLHAAPCLQKQQQQQTQEQQQQQQQQRRWYTPMTKEEEEDEKQRVASLTPFQKDQELRMLNRELAKLDMKRGINTGELYTWSGKYKALARDYGMPLMVWYWAVWGTTAALCYAGITVFDVDTMALVARMDSATGFDMASKIGPETGKIAMAIILNEALEPIRLPVVIATVKPVMHQIFPPKF